jgi:hypothetical protein
MAKSKRQPHQRLPLFVLTAARTKYGFLIVGANGLESPLRFSLRLGARRFELSLIAATCLHPAFESPYADFA